MRKPKKVIELKFLHLKYTLQSRHYFKFPLKTTDDFSFSGKQYK